MQTIDIDILIHARWVIPVEPEASVLQDHALAIHKGRILEVLPSTAARQKFCAAQVHQLPEHALIPGFVNAHTHASMSLLRGLADDKPLMDWLQNHIWPTEARLMGEEFVRDGSRLAIAEMIRGGTTCFNDMYFFPDVTAKVAIETGIRASIGMIVIDFPSAWAKDTDAYIQQGLDLFEMYQGEPRLAFCFAPHAPYTVSDDPLKRIQSLSEELNLPVHMHVHETAHEVQEAYTRDHRRPLQRLLELGLVNQRLQAVHMTQLEPDEIALLAEHGAHVMHCPESNLKLASGFCPVEALHQAGVNVALGTDGCASNNDLDMLGEMRTAALLAKCVAQDAAAIPAHAALRMATLNGAMALGLDAEIGSLLPGKSADCVAIHLHTLETLPLYDPISQIAYTAGRNLVTDVWVAGQALLRHGKLTMQNEQELADLARSWQTRITN